MKNLLLDPSLTRQFFVGFDPLLDQFAKRLSTPVDKFPPHNIIKLSDTRFQIVLAIAGFTKSDIEITVDQERLVIKGGKAYVSDVQYLYQGISNRAFNREFILQDDVEVGSAKFEDGMLTIELERIVPEENKPRLIALN